jgi:UDP-N-acetylglucosamine--N-acetylmuramyl-(pentapeptide) pyrophosphoryl-undecaprenol N-acetylglucosamine transferase
LRVVFAGGGTGGHLAPGIALAERLARGFGAEVIFLSVGKELEEELVGKAGYKLVRCPARPLKRSLFGAIAFLFTLVAGIWKAVGCTENFEAEVIIGLGGYASTPGVIAAWILGKKTVLLEQNVLPGAANRFLERFAVEVVCQWRESLKYLRRGKFLGNPVRHSVLSGTREDGMRRFELDANKKTILVMGGSQGAEWIDRAMMRATDALSIHSDRLQVIHIASSEMKEPVEENYKEHKIDARVQTFISNIGSSYAVAELAVCRAGGSTIAELTCFGVPMVLVPYPYAAGGHQLLNAQAAEKAGAAIVLRQEEGEGALGGLLSDLIWDEKRLRAMRGGALSLGRPEAAQQIAQRIVDLVEEAG